MGAFLSSSVATRKIEAQQTILQSVALFVYARTGFQTPSFVVFAT